MKNLINPVLSLTLLALCTTASTGCIIIIEPEEPPHGPILDVPEPDIKPCHTLAGECDDGFEMVSMGEDINGCPILSCEPISSATCEDDGDCERPDQVCLPDPECASSDDCLNICQTFTPPPPTPPVVEDLCQDVECEAGYTCVVETHVSPVTGERTERAACLAEDEVDEEEETRVCYSDSDCGENERCAYPGEESFDEDTNCMFVEEGVCVSTLI